MTDQPTNPFEESYSLCEDVRNQPFSSLPITLEEKLNQNQMLSRYIDSSDSPIVKINLSSQASTNRKPDQQEKNPEKQNIHSLKMYAEILEKRNEEMAINLQKEKIKNQHFEQALNLIKREDKNTSNKLHEQSVRLSMVQLQLQKQKLENQTLQHKFDNAKAENIYLKELIMLANTNYENLQRKYEQLMEKNQENLNENAVKQRNATNQLQEIKNVLASLMKTANTEQAQNSKKENLKNNYSSMKSQKQEMEDIYRKMFVKTLKTKK